METFNAEDPSAAVVITGWVDRIKAFLPEKHWKWMPVVAIATGILYGVVVKPGNAPIGGRIILGATLGLTASGLFAGANSLLKKK